MYWCNYIRSRNIFMMNELEKLKHENDKLMDQLIDLKFKLSKNKEVELIEFLKDLHGQKLEKSQKIEEDKYLEDNFNVEKKVKKDDENDENFWN